MTGPDRAVPDLLASLRDSLRTCPKTAREGRYLLTCCRPVGHDGDCWCNEEYQLGRHGTRLRLIAPDGDSIDIALDFGNPTVTEKEEI